MRVLLITGEFPPMQGGVGDFTNEIAKGMAARGVEVSVLTSRRAAPASRSASDLCSFSVLPLVDHWGWSSLRVVGRCIRDWQPDLVSIQYQTGAFGMHPAIDFLPRYLRDLTSNPHPPSPSPVRKPSEQERGILLH
jgi:polysaccharide biosynthesis protein PslF